MTDRWTHASPDPIAVNLESSLTPSMPSNIVSHSHSLSTSCPLPKTIADVDDSDSDSDSESGSDDDDEDSDSDEDEDSDSDEDEDSDSDEDEDSDSDEDEGSDSESDSDSDSSDDSSDDDSESEDSFSSDLNSRETESALPQEQLSAITIAALPNSSTSPSVSIPTSHSGNVSMGSQSLPPTSPKMTASSSASPKSTQGPPPTNSSSSHTSPTPDSAAKSVSSTEITSSRPPPSPSPSTPNHSETSSSDPHQTSSPDGMKSLKQSPSMSGNPSSSSGNPSGSSSPSHSTSVNVDSSMTSVHNSTSLMVSTTSSSHSITSSTNSISSTVIPSHSILNEPQVIVSTGPEATTVPSSHANHGFFSDHSLVAGVFVAVTVVILIILGLLPWIIARCRRRRKRDQYQPAKLMISRPNPFPYDDETHHKRASQMRTFGDILSAGASGASRPVSNGSDGSHTPTHDSHHSTAPMIQRNSKTHHPAVLLPAYSNVHSNFTPYNENKLPIFDLPTLPRDAGIFQVESINLIRENTFYPQTNEHIRHRYGPTAQDNFRGEEKNDGEEHHVTPKSLRTVPLLNFPRPHEDTRIETPRNSMLLTPPQSGRPIIPPRNPRRLTISSATLDPPPKIFPHPLLNQSQHSVAQSSPSIYPPTLPGEGDHEAEDEYWKKQGFENVAFSSDKPVHRSFRQSMPESSLGLQLGHHDNSSETTIGPGHKNGQVHSNVQFSNGHKRTSSMPPDVLVSEGRYPLLTYKATRF